MPSVACGKYAPIYPRWFAGAQLDVVTRYLCQPYKVLYKSVIFSKGDDLSGKDSINHES